jgi:P-type Mg2+ transporter
MPAAAYASSSFSSLFDFATFGIMLWVFHAGEALFQTGWFVESLATQTLVIFVIRTRRVPFFRSVASAPMALAAVGITAIGAVLPYTGHLAHVLGFRPLPGTFFFALAGIVVVYLVLVEIGKYWFYRLYHAPATPAPRHRRHGYRVHRRAARFAARTLHPARGHDAGEATPVRQDSKVAAG